MTDWIEPLQMETWLKSVFAGTGDIFLAVALMVIFGLAGYFKMNMLSTFFILAVFLLMFSGFIGSSMIILIAIIGGLLIGNIIAKIFAN